MNATIPEVIPFAGKQTPTSDELAIAGIIWQHQGSLAPISIAEIQGITGKSERFIKDIVEQLVVTHRLPIGARRQSPFGYFIVTNEADQAAAVGPYRSQIIAMWRRLRVLESPHNLRELLGQLTLEQD